MSYETILFEQQGGIVTITLNRPERLNAYTSQMRAELLDALTRVDKDDDARVVVITGAGRAFCSGADARDYFGPGVGRQRPLVPRMHQWSLAWFFRHTTRPIIASINGPTVGLGLTLACACDIRIASEEARLGLGFVRVGLMPEFGGTYNVTRVIGIAKACELLFTSKLIDAKEAKEIGLVNQIVPAAKLKEATYEMARTIAQGAPLAIQIGKRALYQGLDTDLATQMQFESFGMNYLYGTEDHREGTKAFLEKRPPQFQGR